MRTEIRTRIDNATNCTNSVRCALSAAYAADRNPFNGVVDPGNPNAVNGRDFNVVSEETWAVYGQVTFEGELGNWIFLGCDYVRVEATSNAGVTGMRHLCP